MLFLVGSRPLVPHLLPFANTELPNTAIRKVLLFISSSAMRWVRHLDNFTADLPEFDCDIQRFHRLSIEMTANAKHGTH